MDEPALPLVDEVTEYPDLRPSLSKRVERIPQLLRLPSPSDVTLDIRTIPPLRGLVKRLLDIAASTIFLVLTLPVMLIVAGFIRLDSPGPALYRQTRVGRGGRPFKLFKLRTMRKDSDAVLAEYLRQNPEQEEEWRSYRKLKEDPRVTRLGRFLRKYSLDELPQLFNVLRGNMSLVGPRPVVFEETRSFGEHGPIVFSMRPGLTGLWAVSGRNEVSYDERAQMESRYVQDWTLLLDFQIILRTVPAVLTGHGAY
jgi:lipopolysaccharide/colanic/teichoic acid biosynthesis glycosyltransferase